MENYFYDRNALICTLFFGFSYKLGWHLDSTFYYFKFVKYKK